MAAYFANTVDCCNCTRRVSHVMLKQAFVVFKPKEGLVGTNLAKPSFGMTLTEKYNL